MGCLVVECCAHMGGRGKSREVFSSPQVPEAEVSSEVIARYSDDRERPFYTPRGTSAAASSFAKIRIALNVVFQYLWNAIAPRNAGE